MSKHVIATSVTRHEGSSLSDNLTLVDTAGSKEGMYAYLGRSSGYEFTGKKSAEIVVVVR